MEKRVARVSLTLACAPPLERSANVHDQMEDITQVVEQLLEKRLQFVDMLDFNEGDHAAGAHLRTHC